MLNFDIIKINKDIDEYNVVALKHNKYYHK